MFVDLKKVMSEHAIHSKNAMQRWPNRPLIYMQIAARPLKQAE